MPIRQQLTGTRTSPGRLPCANSPIRAYPEQNPRVGSDGSRRSSSQNGAASGSTSSVPTAVRQSPTRLPAVGGGSTSAPAGGTASASIPSRGALAARRAASYRGVPYVRGGESYKGIDCSGLTQQAWASQHVTLPRTAAEQFHATDAVNLRDAQPGDLLYFSKGPGRGPISHVAIYAGDGWFTQASSKHGAVTRERLNQPHYIKRLRKVGRVR